MITALSFYAIEYVRRAGDDTAKRCELAAGFLQDDSLNAYLGQAKARRLTNAASARVERCLRQN